MDFKEKIVALFNKYDIELSPKQAEMFEIYKNELVEWNNIHNLTAITDDDGIMIKHFLDSALPYKEIEDGATVIDIGTGAGFPSVPLMILNNTLKFTLVDSVDKKLNFVRHIVSKLGFNSVNIIHSRCEDLAKNSEYREKYDYSVARAVSSLTTLMEYTIPFVKIGGKLVCYKGSNYQDEIDGATNTFKVLKADILKVVDYPVEEMEATRYALVICKRGTTDVKYPRGMNKPRLKPLN